MNDRAPPPSASAQRLFDWAAAVFRRQKRVSPRVAIDRPEGVQSIEVWPYVMDIGSEGVVQGAAVLSRMAGDDDAIAVFTAGKLSGRLVGVDRRTGLAPGTSAILVVRTKNGEALGRMFQAEQQRGGYRITTRDIGPEQIKQIGDWTDEFFDVDPEFEARLVAAGFPGAQARPAPVADPSSLVRPVAAPVAMEPPRDAARKVPPEPERGVVRWREIRFPWEAARGVAERLLDVSPQALGREPYAPRPTSGAVNARTRSFAELVRDGWRTEPQAIAIARLAGAQSDHAAALEVLVASRMPWLAKAFGCACVAARTGDRNLALDASRRLIEDLDAAAQGAGGEDAWLASVWPEKEGLDAELGAVGVACAAVAAFWRIAHGLAEPFEAPLVETDPIAIAFVHAKALRARLLDRLAAHGATPGERLVDLAHAVLGSKDALGQPDLGRWLDAAAERRGKHAPARVLRDYAAIHAVVLHAAIVMAELAIARVFELKEEIADAWHPERVPIEGLLARGRTVVAHHLLSRAALASDVDAVLSDLARAVELAKGDEDHEAIVSSFNEARFRAPRWDDALLTAVMKESGDGSLAASAEGLVVAEALKRKREAAIARKRLSKHAAGSPHRWIAEVRVAFGRPDELATPERIKALERGAPPEVLDPAERVVFALYGADPAAEVAKYRRALAAQREAIERAREQSSTHVEPAREEPPARPEVPASPGHDAATQALAALRNRLDRPKMARHALKTQLEAHARRALELAAIEDAAAVATWLEALGADGLVAELDRAIQEPDLPAGATSPTTPRLQAALELAEDGLAQALASAWRSGFEARLRIVWPLLAQVHGGEQEEVAGRAAELHARAVDAGDAEVRGALERELADLLDVTQRAARQAASELPGDDARPAKATRGEDDDGFRDMVVAEWARERSRRELDTPDWALAEGMRQVLMYNLARGGRDLKMLRGTRVQGGGALWELRHHSGRGPLRVMYTLTSDGPQVVAFLAKQDEAHQRRMIERVMGWLNGGE